MSQEEKYKLALFAVIRNSTVMPQGVKLGKTMHEINTMAVAVMANTHCPECGAKCWRIPLAEIAEEQGARGLCTMCALKKGVGA